MLGLQQVKKCGGNCRKELPLSHFKLNCHGNHCSLCIQCQESSTSNARKRKLDEIVPTGQKRCAWCKRSKQLAEFPSKKSGVVYSHCLVCYNKHKIGQSEYKNTEAGKRKYSTWASSKNGKAHTKKGNQKKVALRKVDSAARLNHSLLTMSSQLIRSKAKSSVLLAKHTAFVSATHFLSVMKHSVKIKGFNWSDFNVTWTVDHKIPRSAFDFKNPEDVRRCWSPKNLHVLSPADNKAKAYKLLNHYLMEAETANFPTSWNSQFPSELFKQKFYDRLNCHEDVAGPSTEPLSDEECPDSD
jgi:hypothetical protein